MGKIWLKYIVLVYGNTTMKSLHNSYALKKVKSHSVFGAKEEKIY
jgi:hypothetical protein